MYDKATDSDAKRAVTLYELCGAVWSRRASIATVMLAMILLAVLYLHIATPLYTATLDVVPVLSSSSSLSKRSGGLGQIASLAGLGLPQSNDEAHFQLYVEGLQSYAVADQLSKRTALMRRLYPGEWDDQANGWRQHDSVAGQMIGFVKMVLGMPTQGWGAPDGTRLQHYLETSVTIEQSTKRMIVTINYSNPDPQLAADFLRTLHETTESTLRRAALARATQYSDYLQKKLNTVTVEDYRSTLTEALIDQEKSKMAASATTPFAAEPFGDVNVLPRPTSPKASFVLIGFVILGLFFGVLASLLAAAGVWPWFDRIGINRPVRGLFGRKKGPAR